MSMVFKEIWEDRSGDVDETALVRRTRTWRGHVTNAEHIQFSDYEVIELFSAATGIRRYTTYVDIRGNEDATCRAVSLNAKQQSDAFSWIVTVTYTTGRASTGGVSSASPRQQRERAGMARRHKDTGEQPSTDPTERTLVVRWGTQEYQEALTHDLLDTRTVMNSAGERFVPIPMRTLSLRTLTIERNELLFDPVGTWDYENTVNDGTWYGFPEKSVLCKSITADSDHESGVNFWRVTYVFWIRFPTWELDILDAGYNERRLIPPLVATVLTPILDKYGQPVSGPQLLNGEGAKLTPVDGDPVFLTFNQFLTADFTALNIGG